MHFESRKCLPAFYVFFSFFFNNNISLVKSAQFFKCYVDSRFISFFFFFLNNECDIFIYFNATRERVEFCFANLLFFIKEILYKTPRIWRKKKKVLFYLVWEYIYWRVSSIGMLTAVFRKLKSSFPFCMLMIGRLLNLGIWSTLS